MNGVKWTVLRNAAIEWTCGGDTHIDLEIRGYCDRHTPTCFSSEADLYNYILGKLNGPTKHEHSKYFKIKKVHFNPPATVVLWEDGTKTVVKAQDGEDFDPEKGLAMAITKKTLGNQGNYYETIKKWCEPYWEKEESEFNEDIQKALERINTLAALAGLMSKKKEDDSNGN